LDERSSSDFGEFLSWSVGEFPREMLDSKISPHGTEYKANAKAVDDLDILPEWIAYHYHALGLRHLVVAVDPETKQIVEH
jgi:hypothetical protein